MVLDAACGIDLGLPDIDGFEVLQRLRAFSDVPVVIALEPTIAAEIQTLSMAKDGDRFWDGFKNLARRRKIRAYRTGSQDETERLGLADFFRNIDVYDENDGPAPHE